MRSLRCEGQRAETHRVRRPGAKEMIPKILKPLRGRCIFCLVNLATDRASALQRRESAEANTTALTQGNASSRKRRRAQLKGTRTHQLLECRPCVLSMSAISRSLSSKAMRCTAGTCTSRGALMLKPTGSDDRPPHCATDMPRSSSISHHTEPEKRV